MKILGYSSSSSSASPLGRCVTTVFFRSMYSGAAYLHSEVPPALAAAQTHMEGDSQTEYYPPTEGSMRMPDQGQLQPQLFKRMSTGQRRSKAVQHIPG